MPSTFWARTDSGSANNPALNLTGDPATQVSFVASGSDGDLFLEQPSGGGIDPDTQVMIDGVLYDFTFELSGTMPTKNSDGAQQVPEQYEGSVVNIITVQNYPSAGETTRLSFMPEETATEDDMNSFGKGAIDVQDVDHTPTSSPVCFAGGTMILTPNGEVMVEDLQAGDLVTTLDDGPMPILWMSKTKRSWPMDSLKSKPVKIAAGALGPNLPRIDLVVSPQHKVLLSRSGELSTAGPKVLAPAKGLLSLPGVRTMKGKREVVYYHILMARHSILISNGMASESFYPGPSAMQMLRPHQRNEVLALFPDLQSNPDTAYGPSARTSLTRSEAETMAAGLGERTSLASAA